MKIKTIVALLVVMALIFAGCSAKTETTNTPAAEPTQAATEPTQAPAADKPEVTTTASIVNEAAAFEKAVSKDGTWIIAALNDLTFENDLVIDGTFKNGKKDDAGNEIIQRKLAPYTQDDKHNIIDRFTLKAPKFVVNSENCRFQGGVFEGDVYVNANGFNVNNATIKGNIYFSKDEYKASYTIDDKSTVTGTTEVKAQ